MNDDLKSSRTELHRYPTRGHHDFDTVAAILDEAFVCHVGFVANGQPYVLPMGYGRNERVLYLQNLTITWHLPSRGLPTMCDLDMAFGDRAICRRSFTTEQMYESVSNVPL